MRRKEAIKTTDVKEHGTQFVTLFLIVFTFRSFLLKKKPMNTCVDGSAGPPGRRSTFESNKTKDIRFEVCYLIFEAVRHLSLSHFFFFFAGREWPQSTWHHPSGKKGGKSGGTAYQMPTGLKPLFDV